MTGEAPTPEPEGSAWDGLRESFSSVARRGLREMLQANVARPSPFTRQVEVSIDHLDRGEPLKAEESWILAVELAAREDDPRPYLFCLDQLASAQMLQQAYDRALQTVLATIRCCDAVFGPKALMAGPYYLRLANVYRALGDLDQARRAAALTYEVCQEDLDGAALAAQLNAAICEQQGDLIGELAARRQFVRALCARHGTEHPDVGDASVELGTTYLRASFAACNEGRGHAAVALANEALEELPPVLGTAHPMIGSVHYARGLGHRAMAEYRVSLEALEQGLAILQDALGAEHPKTMGVVFAMATANEGLGHHERAEALYDRVLEIELEIYGADHPALAEVCSAKGQFLLKQGRYSEAGELLEKAQAIWTRVPGSEPIELLGTLEALFATYVALRHWQRAVDTSGLSISLIASRFGPDHPSLPGSRDAQAAAAQHLPS